MESRVVQQLELLLRGRDVEAGLSRTGSASPDLAGKALRPGSVSVPAPLLDGGAGGGAGRRRWTAEERTEGAVLLRRISVHRPVDGGERVPLGGESRAGKNSRVRGLGS